MRPLRIGVNALYLIPGGVGGTEIYLRNLLPALAAIDSTNHYTIFANRETGSDLAPRARNFELVRQSVPARVRSFRILWEQTVLAASARRLDVLFNPGFTAPVLCPCPMVTVFHDLQHKRHPEHFRWFDLPFWRVLLYASAYRSRRLVAVSDATRQDLQRFYRLPESSIDVVPHGVEERFFEIGRERRAEIVEPYFLCVSTLHPHKNLERLIRAFAVFRQAAPDYRLVLTGLRGFHTRSLERIIAQFGLDDVVQLTGWVSREELYGFYSGARAFVYPSTFEGFGMPVLEALAAAIPTACSAIEPLETVAGDAAGKFPPEDEGAIAKALHELAHGPLINENGPRQASKFTWKRAAELTLEAIYRSTSSS